MGQEAGPQFPCIASSEQLRRAVRSLAERIARDHHQEDPVLVLAVLKGAVVFLADLVRDLPIPLEIEFVSARSYRGRAQEEIEIRDDLDALGLQGRDVLLLDCVLDSGRTLTALRREVAARHPATLKTCVLLSKRREREVPIEPEYVGLAIPDVFVVGYGLDHNNRWRHLPYVAEYDPELVQPGGPER
jgi:hypoxanthine phosphoribosyltransferase